MISIVQLPFYAVRTAGQELFVGDTHVQMVGGVCRLADPVIVERIVRLGCDNIFVRVINSSLAPRRTILARDAAHIHAHTIGKGNGLELNLVLLFASVGVLLDFVHALFADNKALNKNLTKIGEILIGGADTHDCACQRVYGTDVIAQGRFVETADTMTRPETALKQMDGGGVARTSIDFAKLNLERAAIVHTIYRNPANFKDYFGRNFAAAIPIGGIVAGKIHLGNLLCVVLGHTDGLFKHSLYLFSDCQHILDASGITWSGWSTEPSLQPGYA